MSLLQLIILSMVQGVTEWLPISSSGHVLLVSIWFGLVGPDELLINAMAHVGTLFSVLIYFRKDVIRAMAGALALIGLGSAGSADRELAIHIIAATPIALVTAFAFTMLPDGLVAQVRSLWVVIGTTVLFGIALWWADRDPKTEKSEAERSIMDATLIGATQGIAAILPGTSRSGITMTAARALGFARQEAARFSMLIGIPLIGASGAYAFYELVTAPDGAITLTASDAAMIVGLSFIAGYVSIAALMQWLARMSFLPFVVYRLLLGAGLLLASPVALNLIPA
ncbi:MAG: undecaprenyl-diphosphate phosphatase [Pseudomonadota bacterium]